MSGFFCRGGASALFHLRGASVEIIKQALSLMLCLGYSENKAMPPTPSTKPFFPYKRWGGRGQDQNFHHFGTSWTWEAHSSKTENVLVDVTQVPYFTKLLESLPNTYWNGILSAPVKPSWLLPLRKKFSFLIYNWIYLIKTCWVWSYFGSAVKCSGAMLVPAWVSVE